MSDRKKHVTAQAPSSTREPLATDVERGSNLRGKQDDHTTAFAVLTQAIQQSILRKGSAQVDELGRMRITPVIEEVELFATREMKSLEKNEIVNIDKILAGLITICPDKLKKEIDKIDEDEPLNKALAIIEEYGKYCEKNKDTKFQTVFLALYSKFLFFQEGMNLSEELKSSSEAIQDQAEQRANELVEKLETAYQELKTTAPEIAQLPTAAREAIKQMLLSATLPPVQDMHARSSTEHALEPYVAKLNRLAFATFKPVGGKVSSRSRHAGSGVSSAMENFAKACATGNVDDAVINMALLLDFYPLSAEELQQQREVKKQIIAGKIDGVQNAKMETRAKHLALTRDNDPDIFAYVVARHWNHMCEAFPELKNSPQIADIKQGFLQHMLARWRYADLQPEESAKVSKGSTGFEQEQKEIQKKADISAGIQSNSGRWEITGMDEVACKTKTEAIIQSYQGSGPLSPTSAQYSPLVSDSDPFLDLSATLPLSPAQVELQERLAEENKTLKEQLDEKDAMVVELEARLQQQSLEIAELQQQLATQSVSPQLRSRLSCAAKALDALAESSPGIQVKGSHKRPTPEERSSARATEQRQTRKEKRRELLHKFKRHGFKETPLLPKTTKAESLPTPPPAKKPKHKHQ